MSDWNGETVMAKALFTRQNVVPLTTFSASNEMFSFAVEISHIVVKKKLLHKSTQYTPTNMNSHHINWNVNFITTWIMISR